MENSFSQFVSVIVPVYNDGERLKLCLVALDYQTYPKNLYEVIVIDNGSDEAENIQKIVNKFTQTCFTFESKPGSYAARNHGLSIAKGEIIAFTDADCIPKNNWLEKGVEKLLSVPNCGLVGGKIEIFFNNPHQLTPVEVYEKVMALPQKEFVETYHYGATANVFTWKKIIQQVGDFNSFLKSGGDVDWGNRVYGYGYHQIYAENVCVLHPARYSFRQLSKKTRRYIGGNYDLMHYNAKDTRQFYWRFLVSLSLDLIPPVNFTLSTFADKRLTGIKEKIIVSMIFWWLRYISALEKLRLLFGGKSARE